MEISQVLTTCSSALPQFVYLIAPETPHWWIDLLKTLSATLVGAGLAFFINFYFQSRQHTSDQRTAGNLALAMLSRQYGDFVIAKTALELELTNSANSQIPLWRALKPTLFEFNSDLFFDFKSLAFFVADGSDKLFVSLVNIETRYHELRKLLASHSEAASQMQHKFTAAGWKDQIIPSEDVAKNAVGLALVGELDSLVGAIEKRIATQEAMYLNAGEQLESFMRAKFKSQIFSFRALGAKAGLSPLDGK